nr:MAG TPA: hypothetical protein [Caudoviricetes sp.]
MVKSSTSKDCGTILYSVDNIRLSTRLNTVQ